MALPRYDIVLRSGQTRANVDPDLLRWQLDPGEDLGKPCRIGLGLFLGWRFLGLSAKTSMCYFTTKLTPLNSF
jgi:hypothetical protein